MGEERKDQQETVIFKFDGQVMEGNIEDTEVFDEPSGEIEEAPKPPKKSKTKESKTRKKSKPPKRRVMRVVNGRLTIIEE